MDQDAHTDSLFVRISAHEVAKEHHERLLAEAEAARGDGKIEEAWYQYRLAAYNVVRRDLGKLYAKAIADMEADFYQHNA
jgi:hypothetical protein